MKLRVGFLTEGHDHLIFHALLAKLLEIEECQIVPDTLDGSGHGRDFVLQTINSALRRFYAKGTVAAIISTDNDGDLDLQTIGILQDPKRPRHWLHTRTELLDQCAWCKLHKLAEKVRPALNWIRDKPGSNWPIIYAVPVESIEAWLLIIQAILEPGHGSLYAEKELRSNLKMRFYNKNQAPLVDVKTIALGLIRRRAIAP